MLKVGEGFSRNVEANWSFLLNKKVCRSAKPDKYINARSLKSNIEYVKVIKVILGVISKIIKNKIF